MSTLIAIEGISGVGKTTHSRLLRDWLRKNHGPTLLLYEPSNSPFGRQIKKAIVESNSLAKRGIIRQKQAVSLEAMLFAADRLIQQGAKTLPALKDGKIVILDRSVYSSYAYQQARGLNHKFIRSINRFVSEPDLVIVLDADVELAKKRLKSKFTAQPEFDAIFDAENILKRARKSYHKLVNKNPNTFKLIKTLEPIGKPQKEIRKFVNSFLKEKGLFIKKA